MVSIKTEKMATSVDGMGEMHKINNSKKEQLVVVVSISCIGVYVSVEHHWILLFDLNMLRMCTYGTLEYHILCQCTHLLYVLLCTNTLSYVRPVILTKTNIYIFY